jgi:hypothetical protein
MTPLRIRGEVGDVMVMGGEVTGGEMIGNCFFSKRKKNIPSRPNSLSAEQFLTDQQIHHNIFIYFFMIIQWSLNEILL